MDVRTLIFLVGVIGLGFYFLGRYRIVTQSAQAVQRPHSLLHYYGLYPFFLAIIPSCFIIAIMQVADGFVLSILIEQYLPADIRGGDEFNKTITLSRIENIASGVIFGSPEDWLIAAANKWLIWSERAQLTTTILAISSSILLGSYAYMKVNPGFRSRNAVEQIILVMMMFCSGVAILTTIGIIFSVIFESLRFFALVSPMEFLMGLTWNPQFEGAERAGSGQEGLATYGSVPLFAGTFLISAIALTVAIPVGLMAAIYLSEYASPRIRATVKPLMEILAGIPTVVYGFFAALTVAPLVRGAGESIGLTVASESALAAGLVMGIMIIPFVSSLSDDVINAVPQSLRDAALGLGSTRSEMTKQVVLPAALPGIVASVLLAVSRAVGETMIVVMAAGLAANLSANPLDAVTTVTAQIVTILVGDQEFESAKTLSAFALALTLIVITLVLNLIALQIVKKYREQYD